MKAKFGAIVVDGRGKIGGHVASKNRAGAYFRTKVTPVNRQTASQVGARNRLTSISQAWRGLTQVQRDAWNNAVELFKKSNVFGDLVISSGFNLYQQLNNNILLLGGDMINVPPVVSTLDSFSELVLTGASAVPALSLALTVTGGDDSGYIVMATPGQSAGKSFVKSEFRIISVSDGIATSPINLLSAYTAKFGSMPSVGKKIFVKIIPVGAVSGLQGSGIITSVILTA